MFRHAFFIAACCALFVGLSVDSAEARWGGKSLSAIRNFGPSKWFSFSPWGW